MHMAPKATKGKGGGGQGSQQLLSKFFTSKSHPGDQPRPSAHTEQSTRAENTATAAAPPTTAKRAREPAARPSSPERAAKAKRVLDPAPPPADEPSSQNTPAQKPKYTPLESQVVEIKKNNPGVLILVEVGYKFRLFGKDAEIAASICNIYAYQEHNFLTASFPVYRLPVYTRRLVNAGYKVGVVRQVETAALKAQSSTRSAPFTRQLTALYTAATLDAAQKADKLGEEAGLEEFAEVDDAAASKGGSQPRYMLFVAEEVQDSAAAPASAEEAGGTEDGGMGSEGGAAAGEPSGSGGGEDEEELLCAPGGALEGRGEEAQASGQAGGQPQRSKRAGQQRQQRSIGKGGGSSSRGGPQVALVAVEPSTGDVQQGACSGELDTALIALAPAEIITVPPLSKPTARLLQAYTSASPGCRTEDIGPVPGSKSGGVGKKLSPSQQEEQRMGLLLDLFQGDEAALQSLLSLPRHTQRALAAAAAHLSSFSLEAVLPSAVDKCAERSSNQEKSQVPLFRELSFRCGLHLTANAMRQLEVLTAGPQAAVAGSLLHLLDRTHTPPGSRLLREWVARPLLDLPTITARLEAVEEIAAGTRGGPGPLARLNAALRHLPDIERGLLRALHSTAPPAEFVATMQALQQVPSKLGFDFDPLSGSVAGLSTSPHKPNPSQASQPQQQDGEEGNQGEACIPHVISPLLTRLLRSVASVDVQRTCTELLGALDAKAARENRTVDMFIDEERFTDVFQRRRDVSDAVAKLKSLLPSLAKDLGVRSLEYTTVQNQGEWLIEVPKDLVHKVPQSWQQICATQKVTRYHPPPVKSAINELLVAKERLAASASAAWLSFLKNDFGAHHLAHLKAAATALAHLDALTSLASVSKSSGYCRPTFAPPGSSPKLVIRGGRHPMLEAQLSSGKGGGTTSAVPNDLELRSDGVRAAVITGPNMGGKSCLIRQAALTVIMAQCGSFVPAESCEMTVFDGIYTRMGASDNLLLGRSTFLEELSDAADTLDNATRHSLVIMDELGRGTATHDGVAIAQATLAHLVQRCLSLFVTHYPEVAQLPDSAVRAFHMAYIKEDDPEGEQPQQQEQGASAVDTEPAAAGEEDGAALQLSGREEQGSPAESPAAATEDAAHTHHATAAVAGTTRITFLYRLQEGAADASFGLNVAAMAGLPPSVIQRAAVRAAELRRCIESGKQQQQEEQQQRESGLVPRLEGRLPDVVQALRQFCEQREDLDSMRKCKELQGEVSQSLQ